MSITQTEAIKLFLRAKSPKDLAALYGQNMEVQVQAAQDNGQVEEGEFEGRKWRGFTDGLQHWKSFRIPYGAATNPTYPLNKTMTWDLEAHAEGIGMTGWDWDAKISRWVGFDFDAMVGHSQNHARKLTDDELAEIKDIVTAVPWVTVRKSTGGRGLHLYVFLAGHPTATHTEHAALARAILGLLADKTGYPLHTAVDACGAILWVWHRKYTGEGLQLIKQGTVLTEIPPNWRDHLDVVSGKRKRSIPKFIRDENRESLERLFTELSGQHKKVELDEGHLRLMTWLHENNRMFWFDHDNHMLVTHTASLAAAKEEIGAKGVFTTLATGSDPADHNCFAYPMRNGSWVVRRYSPGIAETETWSQDGNGWTRCYFNRDADLKSASITQGGVESKGGTFIFQTAEEAQKAASMLGASLAIPVLLSMRPTKLSPTRDGRLHVEVRAETHDGPDKMRGWLNERGYWKKLFEIRKVTEEEKDVTLFDTDVRHLVSNGEDYGWAIKTTGWTLEPLTHVSIHLAGLGLKPAEVKQVQGAAIANPWRIVNKPFQPEYPGEREWNKGAVQFRVAPASSAEVQPLDAWESVLTHCGEGLNSAVQADPWCQINGLKSGRDYLLMWVASLFQFPTESLPYLFFWGPQDSGKSTFHEAIREILTGGVMDAGVALLSSGNYNGEFEHAILCYIEELNLAERKGVYNKLKDLVTAKTFLLHAKNVTPCQVTNTLHWVQCGNDRSYVPIFPGDTRIIVTRVGSLKTIIPRDVLYRQLLKEAPDFIRTCLDLHIPPSPGRLRIPVLMTEDKREAERHNMNPVEAFIADQCLPCKGNLVLYDDFWTAFYQHLPPHDRLEWSKIKMGKLLPDQHPKGRSSKNNYVYVANLRLAGSPEGPRHENGPGDDIAWEQVAGILRKVK